VLLIDQIDALSLSLARDQRSLNVLLELIARARLIPNVKVLFSCRTFDFNNDPRLRNVDTSLTFRLTELTEEEITGVLEAASITYARLSPATQQLLRIPLHLDLFLRAISSTPSGFQDADGLSTQIGSLQELYSLLWTNVVRQDNPNAPPVSDRESAIFAIVEEMDGEQKTAVLQSIFSQTQWFDAAARWLASHGLLIPSGATWTFLHQTFFDYCYARRFVESGQKLFETVCAKEQGLSARPQIVQILGFLRGVNTQAYLKELNKFLWADPNCLRYHLRELLLRWFGSLPEPSDDEWLMARRLLADPQRRIETLNAMMGNRGWFSRLQARMQDDLTKQDDVTLENETLPFLLSSLQTAQDEIINMVRPFLGRSPAWDTRLRQVVRNIKEWKSGAATGLVEDMLARASSSEWKEFYELEEVPKANPRVGCRLIRAAFDRVLSENSTLLTDQEQLSLFSLTDAIEVFNGSTMDNALKIAAQAEPDYFLEQMLPWLERVVRLTSEREEDYEWFTSDGLSSFWYSPGSVVHHLLIEAFTTALTALAQKSFVDFCSRASQLARLPYATPQRLLAVVYSRVAASYVEAALKFLVSDQRRLNLGEHEQYDTCQLVKALVPHLADEQLERLEAAIWVHHQRLRGRDTYILRISGLERLYLLQCLPPERMTKVGLKHLAELERKFPGYRASGSPISGGGGFVGSPISEEASQKMSDDAWLSAFKRYRGGYRHKDFLRGGTLELSRQFEHRVNEEPERFYRLAVCVPLDVEQEYLQAFIGGLAKSSLPAEKFSEIIRRFTPAANWETRKRIAWAVRERAQEKIPDDIIGSLETVVRGLHGEDEEWWRREEERDGEIRQTGNRTDGIYLSYLNSTRGSAFSALMRALEKSGNAETAERKWELIEYAADESLALQAGVIEELKYLLSNDRERAISVFEKLVKREPRLLASDRTSDFIYYGMYLNYPKMKPFIRALMDEESETHQQRGAELACIAAISSKIFVSPEEQSDADALAVEVISGKVEWRRGAARIFSRNVSHASSQAGRDRSKEGLLKLLDDEDKGVQQHIRHIFHDLDEGFVFSGRDLIKAYAASRLMQEGSHQFTEFLWKHGTLDPPWALTIVNQVLDNLRQPNHSFYFHGSEHLIRLALRIYTDPLSDEPLRSHAMDAFDRLMERFARSAQRVLEQWDCR
jgi:hypothetical protein